MNAPSHTSSDKWRPLALALGGIAIALTILFRLLPYSERPVNFVPAGAMFLYFGCRMRPGIWYLLPFAAMVGTDLWFGHTMGGMFPIWNYAGYILYVLIAWLMLRHSESFFRIPLAAVVGSVQFFLISNFEVWLGHAMHPEHYAGSGYPVYAPTLSGLLYCYAQGLPFFFKGTFLSDVLFAPGLLAAHAALSRAYFPAERVVPATISEAAS